MKYEIERDVPIPKQRGQYPFRDMEVGDSFLVDPEQEDSIRPAAVRYAKKHNVRFTIRRQDNGRFRCWRIE